MIKVALVAYKLHLLHQLVCITIWSHMKVLVSLSMQSNSSKAQIEQQSEHNLEELIALRDFTW